MDLERISPADAGDLDREITTEEAEELGDFVFEPAKPYRAYLCTSDVANDCAPLKVEIGSFRSAAEARATWLQLHSVFHRHGPLEDESTLAEPEEVDDETYDRLEALYEKTNAVSSCASVVFVLVDRAGEVSAHWPLNPPA